VLDKSPGLWYIIVTGGRTPHPGSGGEGLTLGYKKVTKIFFRKIKKMLDICPDLCYIIITKGKEKEIKK